jgi:maleylacetate reductase
MNLRAHGKTPAGMPSFRFAQPEVYVVYRPGALAALPEALGASGAKRPLLVPSPSQRPVADRAEALDIASVGRFEAVTQHVQAESVDALRALAEERAADSFVALGGGSAIDLCKAASFQTTRAVVAVPTTYGGSELTRGAGRTSNGEKGSVVWHAPRAIVYDPELTLDFPLRASAGSAMNALAHCVEGLYAPQAQPLALLAAEEAIRQIAPALRALPQGPHDLDVRARLLYGGYLAGVALAGTGMALHHRLCHVIGARYGVTHGDANAVVLPHVVRFNAAAAPEAMARVARALETDDVAATLATLARDASAPTSLRELQIPENELARIAELALAAPLENPRSVEPEALRELLSQAWHGA